LNFLFVCSKNRLRSPTAEAVFCNYKGVEAVGAGTSKDSETPLSGDLIEWADIVFVMERVQKSKVTAKYSALLRDKRLVVLGIPDRFEFMQSELIDLLKEKVERYCPSS
jgi:predicted protein tyrosine phosphatase